MPKKKKRKNAKKSKTATQRINIDLSKDTHEALSRYAHACGTYVKNVCEDALNEFATKAKKEHAEKLNKPYKLDLPVHGCELPTYDGNGVKIEKAADETEAEVKIENPSDKTEAEQ